MIEVNGESLVKLLVQLSLSAQYQYFCSVQMLYCFILLLNEKRHIVTTVSISYIEAALEPSRAERQWYLRALNELSFLEDGISFRLVVAKTLESPTEYQLRKENPVYKILLFVYTDGVIFRSKLP